MDVGKLAARGLDLLRGSVAALTLSVGVAYAGSPEVVGVEIKPVGGDRFSVSVTIRHSDEGWDHYANGWEVLDETGGVLGERVLAHPHVDEQPFTRSLTVAIPIVAKRIRVRPQDSVHGEGDFSEWVNVR